LPWFSLLASLRVVAAWLVVGLPRVDVVRLVLVVAWVALDSPLLPLQVWQGNRSSSCGYLALVFEAYMSF